MYTSIGSVTEVGIKQASVFGGTHLADSGRRLCPVVGSGQWVGSRGLCRPPRAAENRLLPWPFSAVSLMKVENFWLLNGSCGCWKIKRLCLKCRSSWRPVGLRRAVEKNVCLTVTSFAYSVMSWEGRLTRGKKSLFFIQRFLFCFYSKPFVLIQNLLSSWDFHISSVPCWTADPVSLLSVWHSSTVEPPMVPFLSPVGLNAPLLSSCAWS